MKVSCDLLQEALFELTCSFFAACEEDFTMEIAETTKKTSVASVVFVASVLQNLDFFAARGDFLLAARHSPLWPIWLRRAALA